MTPQPDSALPFLQPGSFPAGLIHMMAAQRLYFFVSCCLVQLGLSRTQDFLCQPRQTLTGIKAKGHKFSDTMIRAEKLGTMRSRVLMELQKKSSDKELKQPCHDLTSILAGPNLGIGNRTQNHFF